jgi:hypothetical protein
MIEVTQPCLVCNQPVTLRASTDAEIAKLQSTLFIEPIYCGPDCQYGPTYWDCE